MPVESRDDLVGKWSCEERSRKNCRNPFGCHCREITSLVSARESDAKRIAELEAELSDWRNGDLRGVQAHMEAYRSRAITAERALAEEREGSPYSGITRLPAGGGMTPNLDQERVERAARGLAIAAGDDPDKKTYAHDMICTGRGREPLYRWEYWAPLARAAITAYLGDTHADDTAANLALFLSWAMKEGPFDGCHLDGASTQDKAEELGLIVKTTYDPARHGENLYAEAGDDWFEISPEVKALASHATPTVNGKEG